MIRVRQNHVEIEVGSAKESFCTFNLFWKKSNEELLYPDDRCIDVMTDKIPYNNTRSLTTSKCNGPALTLQSFVDQLRRDGIRWESHYRIFYRDNENDDIPIDSDGEYQEALKFLLTVNKAIKTNIMMIIEGDILGAKKALEDKKPLAQYEAPTPIASSPTVTNSEPIGSPKNLHPKQDSEEKCSEENLPNNGTANVASDSLQRDEAFNMLQNYLENFKKQIVDDVVKIVEEKLLSAFGNVPNDNTNLNHENTIHEPPIQRNPDYEELNTRFRRMRNEMQDYNCPRVVDDRNNRSRPFPAPFPMPPIFPAPGTSFRPSSNPPPIPPCPSSFMPFMNSNDFAKYVSLLAQGAASSHLANNMFPKCNNNLRKNDTQKSKVQKKNIPDITEATEVSENMDESPSDSSSFEILSANSSPTYTDDDDNASAMRRKYKTVDTYDCTSDEESEPKRHENTRNPTGIAQSCNTSQRQKLKEKLLSESEQHSGGSCSYMNGSSLPASSNGMNGTNVTVGNKGTRTRSSENNRNPGASLINNHQSSANREAPNAAYYNRFFGINSHADVNQYANLYTNGNPTTINGSLQDRRNELMNSYHNLLHNERDYHRQYSRPMTRQFPNGDDDSYWNPRYPDEYSGYGMDEYYRRFNVLNSSWVDPLLMNPVITGAYDAAQQALSVAHEVMEKTSKPPGSKM